MACSPIRAIIPLRRHAIHHDHNPKGGSENIGTYDAMAGYKLPSDIVAKYEAKKKAKGKQVDLARSADHPRGIPPRSTSGRSMTGMLQLRCSPGLPRRDRVSDTTAREGPRRAHRTTGSHPGHMRNQTGS